MTSRRFAGLLDVPDGTVVRLVRIAGGDAELRDSVFFPLRTRLFFLNGGFPSSFVDLMICSSNSDELNSSSWPISVMKRVAASLVRRDGRRVGDDVTLGGWFFFAVSRVIFADTLLEVSDVEDDAIAFCFSGEVFVVVFSFSGDVFGSGRRDFLRKVIGEACRGSLIVFLAGELCGVTMNDLAADCRVFLLTGRFEIFVLLGTDVLLFTI